MNYVDLNAVLRAYGSKGAERCVVYGKVVRELERPNNIFSNVEVPSDAMFVKVDVFAVNLGYHASFLKEHGISNKGNMYMVNGSLIAVVSRSISLGDWYSLRGTLRYGTKDLSNTYVGLLTYYKDDSGWHIRPSTCNDIEIDEFSDDPEIKGYLERSVDSNHVIVPPMVSAMSSFRASLSDRKTEIVSEQFSSRTRSFVRKNRSSCAPETDILENLRVLSRDAKSARSEFLLSLVSRYSAPDDDAIRYVCNSILENFSRRSSPSAFTGRALVKEYLSDFKGANKAYAGTKIANYLADCFDSVYAYLFDTDASVPVDGEAWEICKTAFSDRELFFAGIVSSILGVEFSELRFALGRCESFGLSLSRVLTTNPYILGLVCTLRFKDIERIALAFGVHLDRSLDLYRNVVMLNDYINDDSRGSTLFTKTELSRKPVGVVLTKSKFNAMRNYGNLLGMEMSNNIKCFFRRPNTPFAYPEAGFEALNGVQYVRRVSFQELVKAVSDYVRSGLGVSLEDYVTSASLLEKELFIFDTMRKMGEVENAYDVKEIDSLISEYEGMIGFKLEPDQRDAVHLIQHNGFVVAGIAGSGKTTVSNCIVYALEHLEPELRLDFAAPTGKAAKRMQEVVKRPVRTMHSRFKIGLKKELALQDETFDTEGSIAFFFDEGGMLTTNLLYRVLKAVDSTSCRVFLFGDYGQLPPIGKGLPFKDLLRFMPCVFLTVSKRASEGSNIVNNCARISNHSDMINWLGLENGGNFRLLPCRGDHIVQYVKELCSFYLGRSDLSDELKQLVGEEPLQGLGASEDDIQVVTPFSKLSYKWGAKSLNKVLQPLFNQTRGYHSTFIFQISDKVEGSRFCVGDRVIHVDKNMYGMQWYKQEGSGVFRRIWGYGVCNGDVGKLLGFYRVSDVTLLSEDTDCPKDFEYPDFLRDDDTWIGENKFFVAVQYYDYLGDQDIVILYRADLNMYIESNEGIVLKGEDLSRLDLFYAGTTHKLQGSESKVIICPLDSVSYNGFITREMVYTMFTRGRQMVIAIGSVDSGRGSMLSRARRDLASQDVFTIGEVIYS